MTSAAWRDRLATVPLRWQLTAVMTALVLMSLLVINFSAATVVENVLVSRVDSQLTNTARDQMRRGDAVRVPTGELSGDLRNGPALLSGYFTKIVDANGNGESFQRLPEGVSLGEPVLPALDSSHAERLANRPFTVRSVDGKGEWRVIVTPLPNDASLVTAVGLSDVKSTLSRFMTPLLLLSLLTLLAMAMLGVVVVRSRLRALGEVEATAARIAKGDLSQRVPEHDPRTEVGSLATAINTMLAMIETSFAKQKQSETAARESEAQMRRFVADASHELRTPLTSIRGYAELTRQTRGPRPLDDGDVAIERIESEAKRMGNLVEDLLLLARLDQQTAREDVDVDVCEVARDIAADAAIIGPAHEFHLEVSDQPLIVMGDHDQLRRAFSNLVTNAFHHTPAGSVVTLRAYRQGDEAVVDVNDNGPGIEAEDLQRIFDRFFRADVSRTRASGGTGLGLSIVHGIIESHGGKVSVASTPESGTTFSLRLGIKVESSVVKFSEEASS